MMNKNVMLIVLILLMSMMCSGEVLHGKELDATFYRAKALDNNTIIGLSAGLGGGFTLIFLVALAIVIVCCLFACCFLCLLIVLFVILACLAGIGYFLKFLFRPNPGKVKTFWGEKV